MKIFNCREVVKTEQKLIMLVKKKGRERERERERKKEYSEEEDIKNGYSGRDVNRGRDEKIEI